MNTEEKPEEPYRVMENDQHNSPTVHVFQNREHFLNWSLDNDADFGVHDFIEDGEFVDDNMVTWSHYTGLYEIDHTKDPLPARREETSNL